MDAVLVNSMLDQIFRNWRERVAAGVQAPAWIDTCDDLETALAERAAFVHAYKGEGLTACGLEVVGPCPDCANGERT